MMSDERIGRICKSFEAEFGRKATFVVRAPGRVNLIGEHTDYNGGKVLPMAINRYTYMAADRSQTHVTRIRSSLKADTVALDRNFCPFDDDASWVSYMGGVLTLWPHSTGAMDIYVDSDIPMGAGLSSSAALEVATLKLAEAVSGQRMSVPEAAKICQKAENDFAGVPCGIMDQMASLAGKDGHGILLDCHTMEIKEVPLDQESLAFVIVDSQTTHQLADGAYAERRQQCERVADYFGVESLCEVSMDRLEGKRHGLSPLLYRRARHVVSENRRVGEFSNALGAKQYVIAGDLLCQSHESLRDDFDVSTSELDILVDLAKSLRESGGVYGSRLTGGGFGGSVIVLSKASSAKSVGDYLVSQYEEMTGLAVEPLFVLPSDGAEILQLWS